MRVLFLSQWGVNPYQQLLVRELEARGVEVTGELPSLRASLRSHPVIHLQSVRRFLTFGGLSLSILRCVGFTLKLLGARLRGARIVWTVHDLLHPSRRHRRLDRAITFVLARVAHALIVHGRAAEGELAAFARLRDRRKIHVIPIAHFIDFYENRVSTCEARAAMNIEEDTVVILFFGWVRRYKGVTELIRVFRRIANERLVLIVAGAAPEPGYADELHAAARGDARIRLELRSIPDEDVQLFMNASDAVVFPYDRVLTSGAIPVAMGFAKACIVADHGGLADAVDRDGALFYDPSDEASLRAALEEAAASRERLAAMGARNREAVRRWTWRDMAEATMRVYAGIGADPGRAD